MRPIHREFLCAGTREPRLDFDCGLLSQLGISWYYSGQQCANAEYVYYLDTPAALAAAPEQEQPGSRFILFLNECDWGHWNCPDIGEQVRLYIAAEAAWPGVIWVGPCAAVDALYPRKFWSLYSQQTGHKPDPAYHRACVHCYGTANECIERVSSHLAAVSPYGIDRIWLTEFGLPLGLYRSIANARAENQALVDWLERDERVERYAYWSIKIGSYGYHVPSKPISGFHPLAFDWRCVDGTVEERLTDMGLWFAGVGD